MAERDLLAKIGELIKLLQEHSFNGQEDFDRHNNRKKELCDELMDCGEPIVQKFALQAMLDNYESAKSVIGDFLK